MVAGVTPADPVVQVAGRLAGRHPGVAIGVVSPDGSDPLIVCEGTLSQPDGPDVGADTLFEIGSITKVFTSLLLADAVTRGELSLDTPLRALAPHGVRVPSRGAAQITVRHLATHTSGLPRSPLGLAAELRSAVTNANPYAKLTTEALYEALGRTRLRRPPGTGPVKYSNFGAALLGHALVAATGAADFGDLIRTRIAGPLGLADTVISPSPAQRSRLATGHGWRGRTTPHWELPGMAGAGALLSTVANLVTFLQAQLRPDDTSLGPAITLTQHEQVGDRRIGIGLGWLRAPLDGATMLWHNGGTGGFRSFAALVPERGVGAAVLVNSHRSPDLAGVRLLQAALAPARRP